MMDDITIPPTTPPGIANLSTQALRAELARALTVSAQTLRHLAIVWRELESRGEDLSDLRTGLATYLPLIAAGQLDAEVVVRFAGSKTILQLVSRLPIDEQHRLATGGTVDVITVDGDGTPSTRAVPAYALTAMQARLAFDDGRIRHPEEQRSILDSRRLRALRPAAPGSRVQVDRKTGTLKLGRSRVKAGEVLAALRDLSPEMDGDLERGKTVVIQLTDDEHRRLKIRAAEADSTIQDIARLALRQLGAI